MRLMTSSVTYNPRKSKEYADENQTGDQQKIPANCKSTTQNSSDEQLDMWIYVFKKKE